MLHALSYVSVSPGLPNGLKGLQPRAPKAEGPPKPRQKNFHTEFDRRKAVQCAVHGYCRLSSQCSFNNRSTPVEKLVLLSTGPPTCKSDPGFRKLPVSSTIAVVV